MMLNIELKGQKNKKLEDSIINLCTYQYKRAEFYKFSKVIVHFRSQRLAIIYRKNIKIFQKVLYF